MERVRFHLTPFLMESVKAIALQHNISIARAARGLMLLGLGRYKELGSKLPATNE
jgi:hypothetical protein